MSDEFDELMDDFDDQLDLTVYDDAPELVEEVSSQILTSIEEGLLERGAFHLVLTGGTLGVEISRALLAAFNGAPDMYKGLHIYWSDERFVASDSEERNAHPLHSTITNPNITLHEALAPDSGSSIEDAVKDYEHALDGVVIDLNILGVGPDGHVASLFPGIADIDDSRKIFAITDSPKPPASRISFTMQTINESREVWIVAAGESKGDAVVKIIECDLSIPASYVSGAERTRLIVDQAAFLAE
jgi:6-phosphogluconolactonase